MIDYPCSVVLECSFSDALQRTYFNSTDNSWKVTQDLLGEANGDLQPIVDCAVQTGATVRISNRLQIDVTDPIEIGESITVVGDEDREDSLPTFTCSGNEGILLIRYSSTL